MKRINNTTIELEELEIDHSCSIDEKKNTVVLKFQHVGYRFKRYQLPKVIIRGKEYQCIGITMGGASSLYFPEVLNK